MSYSFYGSWESVSGNSGLELARALCTPLDTALLETAVESNGEVIRYLKRENVKFQREKKEPKDLYTHHVVEVLNLLNTDISKGNRNNVRVQPKDLKRRRKKRSTTSKKSKPKLGYTHIVGQFD